MEISLKLSAIIMIPTYCFLFAYAFIMGTWEPKKILTGTIINITIANESYIKKYPEQPVEPTDVIYTIDCGSETHEVYEVFKGCNGGKYKVGDKVFYLYYNEAAEYIL